MATLGSLDHVHIVVPDRAAAARWYEENLGLRPVDAVAAWLSVGGPLHLSADGGRSGIALFEAGGGHDATTLEMGAAFRVDAAAFLTFAEELDERALRRPDGQPLTRADVVDFDLCYAFNFLDPWGNRFELNCYDVGAVKTGLVDAYDIAPVRYWPASGQGGVG